MIKALVSISATFALALAAPGGTVDDQLSVLFGQIGLTDQQTAAIDAGQAVAKVLPWGGPSEVFVFGAVHIDGSPETFLELTRNVGRLSGTPDIWRSENFPRRPRTSSGLTLDPDDLKALKTCRGPATCSPTSSITAFQNAVDWGKPDAAGQANGLARGMVLDLVRAYRRGGNTALGLYRDKDHPARVADQFETMVGRSTALPNVLPELRQYLLKYPDADLPRADSYFYWEMVDFGMKPTIRVNHGVVYRAGDATRPISAVAVSLLYTSHYFHTALDVSICVADTKPQRRGFYLLTLKSSEQDGLTGAKGSILRKVVVSKTRSSLEKGLALIKDTVEHTATTRRDLQ
jgi:hypothetical protein